MQNFQPDGSSVRMRNGNEKHGFLESVNAINPLNVAAYGTSNLFVLYEELGQLTWKDMTASGAGTIVYAPVGASGDDEIHTLYFNGVLFYFGEASLSPSFGGTPKQYNGTTWAASTYTWPSSFDPFGGCVHKNRAFFLGRNSAAYGYTGIDSVSGVVTKVDLAGVLASKANLYIIRSISMSENVTQENVAAFIFSNGEVLAYGGSYPDSSTWGLIARFRISNPIYQNSFCDAKGDSFIFTETEILSLRNIFARGYSDERINGIGATIKNRYSQIIAGIRAAQPAYLTLVKGIYDEKSDRLIISFPYYVETDTGTASPSKTLLLIYDFTVGAWYESYQVVADMSYVASGCYFNNNTYSLLRLTSNDGYLMEQESKVSFIDDAAAATGTQQIEIKIESAPISTSKFGVNTIDGFEVIMRSDCYSGAIFKLIADLGRQTTEGQLLIDQGASIVKPMVNVGITASFAQWSLSGNSLPASTVGLEIYALNVWYNEGQQGSR